MKALGHDGVAARVHPMFREPELPHWRSNYMRFMSATFVGIALWGAWLHSGKVIVGALVGAAWCLVMGRDS